MQKSLLFFGRYGIDKNHFKFQLNRLHSLPFNLGGRYGEGGKLLGMLSMMDLNLRLHHVQQITSQKSYKDKNGKILQM
jgi:hypothetical protein